MATAKNKALVAELQAILERQKERLASVTALQAEQQAALNISKGLNADGSRKTATQVLQEKQADRKIAAENRAAGNPLYNKAVMPAAVTGQRWVWVGGTDTGEWRALSSGGNSGSGGTVSTGDNGVAAATRYAADQATAIEAARIKSERVSAYALLESEFSKYGLSELAGTVKQLILDGASSAEMTIKLRNTPQYQARFAGNTQRLKDGKNVYDEATYLALENAMQQAFTAYGVSGLLGDTREKQQAKLATFIGGDISPTEVKKRIQLAVDEVTNRPDILSAFQTYYPQVTQTDLVSYFLDPKETETKLITKIKASQIGAAASRQGFVTNVINAEDLAALGVTEQQANIGYRNVAAVLPEAQKLAAIEGTTYTASDAEGAYLRNLESEQRKLRKLAERETARFQGTSGVNQTTLKQSTAGQY
jgi:hypothetical protein